MQHRHQVAWRLYKKGRGRISLKNPYLSVGKILHIEDIL